MSNLDIIIEMLRLAEQMGEVKLGMIGTGNHADIYVTLKDGSEVKLSLAPYMGGDKE